MKKLFAKKTLFALFGVCLLFAWVSWLSLSSIKQLQGNARVINYIGIVRGATQRLVKQVLQEHRNDALVSRLDSIVNELITGHGPNNLIALPDPKFQGNMAKVRERWQELMREIDRVHAGADNQRLYDLSEDYFVLVDNTVSSAEEYTEHQVAVSTQTLWTANGVFILALLAGFAYYLSTLALKRRAEMLGAIAFVDPLTKLPNRAACDREMQELMKKPPMSDVAMFMFDMNNLKRANDELGHAEGDQIIADFGDCLRRALADHGFVGRYGGDEFIGIFRDADAGTARKHLARVEEAVAERNRNVADELRRISFAAGFSVGAPRAAGVEDLLQEADRSMYQRKRQMKEAVMDSIIDRVAKSSKELVQVAGKVFGSSRELAGGATRQQEVFEKFSNATQTLRRHAEEYSRSARETSTIIADIHNEAKSSNIDMNLLADKMADIADTAREVNGALKVIDNIAFQTNILALNAAVEAARAGRHGKGFSVVAEEVRTLANRSAESVDTTNAALGKSNNCIDQGVVLSRSTQTRLKAIQATTRTAGELMTAVFSRAQEQEDVVTGMVEDLDQVGIIARRNNETAAANTGAAEQLLSIANYMRAMLDFGKEVKDGPDEVVNLRPLWHLAAPGLPLEG